MAGLRRSSDTLEVRALNRALLARQLLLHRAAMPARAAIEHLVGMQAQVPESPYIGLWTRLEGFRLDDLTRLLSARRVVRIVLMRSTIHLVTVRDGATLRPTVQPAVERGLWTGNYGRQLAGLNRRALAAAARAILEEQPRTFSALGLLLRRRWPHRDAHALAMAARGLLPLIQPPPRGIWAANGAAVHTTFESWTGRTLARTAAPARMMRRYLAAFGPSSVADIQAWSGLTGLREVIEPMRRRLRTFRDAHGRELFDLPHAPRPEPDTDVPPRFLPVFDNVLLAHADRARIVADNRRQDLFAGVGFRFGTVLLDGFVGGRWQIASNRKQAILQVETFEPLSSDARDALEREGADLVRFFVGAARPLDVRVLQRRRVDYPP